MRDLAWHFLHLAKRGFEAGFELHDEVAADISPRWCRASVMTHYTSIFVTSLLEVNDRWTTIGICPHVLSIILSDTCQCFPCLTLGPLSRWHYVDALLLGAWSGVCYVMCCVVSVVLFNNKLQESDHKMWAFLFVGCDYGEKVIQWMCRLCLLDDYFYIVDTTRQVGW